MKKTKLTQQTLFVVLVAIFVGCLLISNVLAGRVFTVYKNWTLTGGVFLFPIVLVVNDILSEVYGMKKIKLAVYCGFGINILAVLMYTFVNILPSPIWFTDVALSYKMALGTTFRTLLASLSAYLVGNLLNAYVMVKLKAMNNNKFQTRAIISTVIGEIFDSVIFATIMFIGVMSLKEILFMIILQAVVKTGIELLVLPITTKLCNQAVKLSEI